MRTLFASLALLTLPLASAQEAALSIAFVQTTQLLAAHPAGQAASQLEEQARAELQEIATTLQPLVAKANSGQSLTPEEQNTLELSQRTYQETQQRYREEYDTTIAPAETQIDEIITQIATENGYTLVLNRELAATSSLVVYGADSIPDITEEVVAAIQAANPGATGGGN